MLAVDTIFQYTTSPRDSNPLSFVVYHEFCAQASNILKYNFFVILKHTKNPNLTNLAQDMFQYNFSLRFLSQDCGLLSPCNKIVLGVVLAKKLHN